MMVTILSQICSVLTYMHSQNLVHGLVSSHAIQLIAPEFAKLGNFEYTIDRSAAASVHAVSITYLDEEAKALSHSHHLEAIFPGEPGLAGFIEAKDDGSGDDNWSCKLCKAPVKSSPATYQHSTFYRPDVLPVAQPTVSKHRRVEGRI